MQKWWKSDTEIQEVMTFWNFMFFPKTLSWPVLTEYSNERVDDVIPSQFSIDFIYRYDKNLIFPLWKYKTCLITTQNKWEIMFTLIYVDMGIWFYQYELKIKNFRNFIYKTYEKLWGHDIINLLILNIHKDWSRNVSEKMWNFKMSQLPYFLSDFHNFLHQSVGKFLLFLLKLW